MMHHKNALRAKIHHAVKHPIGKGTGRELFENDVADVGDAIAVTVALALIGAASIAIEHTLKVNADVAFTVAASAGSHPLSYVLRRMI